MDTEWQHRTCQELGLKNVGSNGTTPGGPEVRLTPPATSTRIIGGGNCLFRALSHIITGSEDQHMSVRQGIVSHMRNIGNYLMGGHISSTLE